ncbi:phytanoyl-CoA dioxygenase family protein [Bauldia sp.]|uniref:phytanoyl-CoA dioxygenase family protein n=1 Tax=Bauldia sp. TaxID=2575872 RepID=UPI003BA9F500
MQTERECLTDEQIAAYRRDGYIVIENRVPDAVLDQCHKEIARLRAEAATLTAHTDQIDLEESHTPDNPRIRRIKLPHTLSPVFAELMKSDAILAPVRDLIGPDLRLHTSKLNMKSAGFGAPVDWHQDWAFYPHTNDDVLAVGVFLDDVGPENGPLLVFPGTHRRDAFDHHVDGVFAGTMSLPKAGLDPKDAAAAMAPAGSISIHHARIVHGSDFNRSDRDRAVLFYEITAADAFPIFGAMSPPRTLEGFDALMLCGEPTIEPRVTPVPVRIPQPQPATQGSIYEIQKQSAAKGF